MGLRMELGIGHKETGPKEIGHKETGLDWQGTGPRLATGPKLEMVTGLKEIGHKEIGHKEIGHKEIGPKVIGPRETGHRRRTGPNLDSEPLIIIIINLLLPIIK